MNKVSNFKLGMFIFVGTALFTVMLAMFGAGVFEKKGFVIETYIDGTVQGLDVGSALKYRGVKIGSVVEIGLADRLYGEKDPKTGRIVVIRMELEPSKQRRTTEELQTGIKNWVDQGMRLKLTSQGITGVAYMEADFVEDPDPPMQVSWTPKHQYIPSGRTQFARVADSIESIARDLENANIPEIAAKVDRLLASMDTAIADANVKKISSDVSQSLARIENVAQDIEEVMADPDVKNAGNRAAETIEELNKTIAEVRTNVTNVTDSMTKTLEETRGAVGDVRGYLSDPELKQAFSRVNEISDRLESTITNIEQSYARKDERIDLILADMHAVSSNMRELSELLSQYPSLAAFGNSPSPSEVYQND